MQTTRAAANPFYVVLVAVGVLFVITACAYGVMTLRGIEPAESAAGEPHQLMELMDRHGFTLLMVELSVLALATFAAIGTDHWWTARQARLRPAPTGQASSSERPTVEPPPARIDAGHNPGEKIHS
ncbi:MAG: hypothetical protein J5I93_01740 [Pirellulaceae bacterium]|nr:hypothetical protein [Pirellulaceae bacterium]